MRPQTAEDIEAIEHIYWATQRSGAWHAGAQRADGKTPVVWIPEQSPREYIWKLLTGEKLSQAPQWARRPDLEPGDVVVEASDEQLWDIDLGSSTELAVVEDADQRERDDALIAKWEEAVSLGVAVSPELDMEVRSIKARRERADVEAAALADSTWRPVDLTSYLDGSYVEPEPTVMPRSDGRCLMYAGKVHSFHGESESAKSLILQIETVRLIKQGEDVLYLDFEDGPSGIVGRMLTFGATVEEVAAHLTYVRPHEGFNPANTTAWRAVLDRPYTLAVVDGVTDSLAMFGLSTKDNDEIAKWQKMLPREIARLTGAAVAVIDHVTKSTEGRGRFAIGGQAKLAGIDGAAFTVEPDPTPRKGHTGAVVLRVGKDRPGGVRPYCGPPRGADRTQEACRITIDSTGEGQPVVAWNPPQDADQVANGPRAKQQEKLAKLMRCISDELVEAKGPMSKNALYGMVKGNRADFDAALEKLQRENFVKLEAGGIGRAIHVTHLAPYVSAEGLELLP